MGFTRSKGLCIAIGIIMVGVFSAIAFLLPFPRTITFWLGYGFAVASTILFLITVLLSFRGGEAGKVAMNLSIVGVALLYSVIQYLVSLFEMRTPLFPFTTAMVVNYLLLGVFLILGILAFMGKGEAQRVGEETDEKVFYIRSLQTDVELLDTVDKKLQRALEDLAESIRFSDPITHSELTSVENRVKNRVDILKEVVRDGDIDEALSVCTEVEDLLKERNAKAKLLKNTPDQKAKTKKESGGGKAIGAAFGLVGLLTALALALIFVVVPSNHYKAACELYDAGHYNEAIVAFESLGSYKDSAHKVDEIKSKVLDERYQEAEQLFADEKYKEALAIYEELKDYKESKARIEKINNMYAVGEVVYFGSYKGESIAWIVLDNQDDEIMLLSKDPVTVQAMNDELENVTWGDSTIRQWLNGEFMDSFEADQKAKIGTSGVFLLSEEEFKEYAKIKPLWIAPEWWLRDETEDGFMYVNDSNKVIKEGDLAVHAKGIRPAMWIKM